MMSIELLDKTRKINRLLHDNNGSKVSFHDVCNILGSLLDSHVFVISRKGKILGTCRVDGDLSMECFLPKEGNYVDKKMNERMLNILSTKENVNLEILGFPPYAVSELQALVSPICIGGERLGTLFLYRKRQNYGIEDIILSEYGAMVIGLEMVHAVREEEGTEKQKEEVFSSAFTALTPLERKAMVLVFHEMEGLEGILITSRVAKEVGITRTVIVNALRKLESAGLIQKTSSGVKGTRIKVLNDVVFREFRNYYDKIKS